MKHENVPLAPASSAAPAQNEDNDSTHNFLVTKFEEGSIWAGLFANLRDTLSPTRLPPLELTSAPIPTPDRMAGKTNPWAIGTATIMNVGLLALFVLIGLRTTLRYPPSSSPTGDIHLKDFTLFAPPGTHPARGGGGGGANELSDPVTGRPPKQAVMPLVPPQLPVLQNPTIAIDSAIAVPLEIKLPDNPSLPTIGVHSPTIVKLASNGPGARTGIGTGSNGGDGPGSGPGYGPGLDGGFGGSVYTPGIGGVTKPIVLIAPEAEFSDEARRQKYQGVCTISIIVDAQGHPQNLRVTQSLGMGLDEKALEAVRKYRFKPALKNGKPVASFVSVEVNFRFY